MKVLVQRQACILIISVQMVPFVQQRLHKVSNNSLRKGKVLYCWDHILSTSVDFE